MFKSILIFNLLIQGKPEKNVIQLISDMYTSQYTTQNPIYSSEYQQYLNNPSQGQIQGQNQDHQDQDYSTYNKHYRNPNVHDPTHRLRYHEQIKRMRLLWDEKGVHTEYSIRYNVTKPGVWITSGPQNGK